MIFIGIDLAWGVRNPTGGAVIQDGQLIAATGVLTDNDAILAFISTHLQGDEGAIVAVDAPLRVPNVTGSRPCDKLLSAEWRQYEAGALPGNRTLLAVDGAVRGETLVAKLQAAYGFQEVAPLPHQTPGRYICEVFPHPAHVALFGLAKTLKYKARPNRTLAERQIAFAHYQAALRKLTVADPPLYGIDELLQTEITGLAGKRLKAYEDTLDAITCAYVAAYLWWHGPSKGRVYGNIAQGHILTPLPPSVVSTGASTAEAGSVAAETSA